MINYHGVLLLDKPIGISSHQAVARLRKIFSARIGHAGTLDPGASGLLICMLGEATKISDYLQNLSKGYKVLMRLGTVTDSQDHYGKMISQKEISCSKHEIENSFKKFIGSQLQIPPMYSALKFHGKPLYKLARKGLEIPRKAREIKISSLNIKKISYSRILFEVHCSKGTYVRTLCHDIGENLGCGAHLRGLRRLFCGPFNIQDAYTFEQIQVNLEENNLSSMLLSIDQALSFLPSLTLEYSEVQKIVNGQSILLNGIEKYPLELEKASYLRLKNTSGDLIAIGQIKDKNLYEKERIFVLQASKVFRQIISKNEVFSILENNSNLNFHLNCKEKVSLIG